MYLFACLVRFYLVYVKKN